MTDERDTKDPAISKEMPAHIAETVQAIALLHAEHHRKSTFTERIADRATSHIGRPRFLLVLMALAISWVCTNEWLKASGKHAPDPPPFQWLALFSSVLALFIAVLILASQRRADKFANLREQMTLEATLLTEQKTRKIIELLEELRRDSPEIRDRPDLEAEQMAQKADPHTVLGAFDESLQNEVLPVEQ